jgi:hypothetical protein
LTSTSAVPDTSGSRSGPDSNINASIHTYGTKNEPSTTGIEGAGTNRSNQGSEDSDWSIRSFQTSSDDGSGFVVIEMPVGGGP